MRPIIGVTCSFDVTEGANPRLRASLNAAYSDAIYAAGGIPFPIATPASLDRAQLDELLGHCRGVLFTGGPDLDPRHYGQPRHAKTSVLHERRDRFDIEFFRRADEIGRPALAVCLGCQIASVARGGCLVQHVEDIPRRSVIQHFREDHSSAFHDVELVADSRIAQIVGQTRFEVNSRHHQVIDASQVGGRLRPVGFAPDGVVEAAESTDDRFLIAVQWHPEDLIDRREHLRLFEALVAAAARV